MARNRGAFTRDRHLCRRPLRGAVLRQRRRAVPGRRAHVHPVPLQGAAVGDPERPHRLRSLPGRVQRLGDHARGQGDPHTLAQPPGDRRAAGSATRAASRTPHLTAADRIREPLVRGRAGSRARLVGRRPGRDRAPAPRRRRPRRHRALGHRDDRAGVRARPAAAGRRARAHGRAARVDLGGARRMPRPAVGDRSGADRARRRGRRSRRPGADRGSVAQAGAAQRGRDRHRRRDRLGAGAPPARRRPCSSTSSQPGNELGDRLRAAERAVLIWSGPGGGGGARLAEAAHELGLERQARLCRLPPPRDAERTGCRAGLGRRLGRRRGRSRSRPAADRVRRRGRRRGRRPGARRARRRGRGGDDVPRARRRLGGRRRCPRPRCSSATGR